MGLIDYRDAAAVDVFVVGVLAGVVVDAVAAAVDLCGVDVVVIRASVAVARHCLHHHHSCVPRGDGAVCGDAAVHRLHRRRCAAVVPVTFYFVILVILQSNIRPLLLF